MRAVFPNPGKHSAKSYPEIWEPKLLTFQEAVA